jgi:hypothetical protein
MLSGERGGCCCVEAENVAAALLARICAWLRRARALTLFSESACERAMARDLESRVRQTIRGEGARWRRVEGKELKGG